MTRPIIQTKGSAGADLCCSEDFSIAPGERVAVSTGYIYDLGVPALVRGRSGLAFRHSIIAFEGSLDASFTDEIKVLLFNLGETIVDFTKGDRIGQIVVIADLTQLHFETKDVERSGGFGSSGK